MASIKLNTLYISQDGLYIHHELDLIKVEKQKETLLKVPIHHLQGICILGNSTISPSLLKKCLQRGLYVAYLDKYGKFMGRLEGSSSGNVLLRKEQFRKSVSLPDKLKMGKAFVAGKIQNSRLNLLRTARDIKDEEKEKSIREAVIELEKNLSLLENSDTLDSVRGYEGNSAKVYFSVFDHCILHQKEDFAFTKRMKRPPRSRINALLSYMYAIITNDCIAACQTVGLDPYVGFLHDDRPGKPSLALDLVEEFRSFADRFVLTLINRKQIQKSDIVEKIGSVYSISDDAKKRLLKAYQERKMEEIQHHFLDQKCRIGELMTLQARLLARTIRGEMDMYVPYIWR